jgi:hypothetical protein
MKKNNAPLMPKEAADVDEFLRLMEKERHALLTEAERLFLKRWNSTHLFHMTRDAKGTLVYANDEQFEAAKEAWQRGRTARTEYAARLKDAPHAKEGKKIQARRSKGAKSTSEKFKKNHTEIIKVFKMIARENGYTTLKTMKGNKGWIQDRVYEHFNGKHIEINEGGIKKTVFKKHKKKGFSLRVIKAATARQ